MLLQIHISGFKATEFGIMFSCHIYSFCIQVAVLVKEMYHVARLYRKNPNNSDKGKIAVITLKLEQYCFTTE